VRTLPFCFRRYAIKPSPQKPRIIIAHVEGSGTAATLAVKVALSGANSGIDPDEIRAGQKLKPYESAANPVLGRLAIETRSVMVSPEIVTPDWGEAGFITMTSLKITPGCPKEAKLWVPVPVSIPHTYCVLAVEVGAPSSVAVRTKLAPSITAETLWISWPGVTGPAGEFVKVGRIPDVLVTVVAKAELAVSAAASAKAPTRADFIDLSEYRLQGWIVMPQRSNPNPRRIFLVHLVILQQRAVCLADAIAWPSRLRSNDRT
jgi:hypothetical protein